MTQIRRQPQPLLGQITDADPLQQQPGLGMQIAEGSVTLAVS
jgi:hypothetical protein